MAIVSTRHLDARRFVIDTIIESVTDTRSKVTFSVTAPGYSVRPEDFSVRVCLYQGYFIVSGRRHREITITDFVHEGNALSFDIDFWEGEKNAVFYIRNTAGLDPVSQLIEVGQATI